MRSGTAALPTDATKQARTVEVSLDSIGEFLRAMEWVEQRDGVWKHPTLEASCPVEMAFTLTMRTIINDATGKTPDGEAQHPDN